MTDSQVVECDPTCMERLLFIERVGESWRHLIVIGNKRWATIRFESSTLGGFTHASTDILDTDHHWPDMSPKEMQRWMLSHWVRSEIPTDDDHAMGLAHKYAPDVV